MKKLLSKTIIYLLVLVSIPYLYFVWQAKQGVDSFLLSHPLGGDFEYKWIWIDLDGKIYLSDIQFYQDSYDPVFSAEALEIIPTSIFDLLDAREHIIYKEYPATLEFKLVNASTNQSKSLFSLFGINYNDAILPYLYPDQCIDVVEKQLPYMKFNLTSEFEIQRTADESLVNFSFQSQEFINVDGRFKINKLTEDSSDGAYISNLSLELDKLSWLHQNTQKCLSTLKQDKEEFLESFSNNFIEKLKTKNVLVNQQVALTYAKFFYIPQTIKLTFDLQEGKTFSQIETQPFYQYQDKTGLSISLNNEKLSSLFEAYDYITEPAIDNSSDESNQPITTLKTSTKTNPYLAVRYSNLKEHLGSKVIVTLYNEKTITGYLDEVHGQTVKLKLFKYKGKTELFFPYKDIKSIYLLVSEK